LPFQVLINTTYVTMKTIKLNSQIIVNNISDIIGKTELRQVSRNSLMKCQQNMIMNEIQIYLLSEVSFINIHLLRTIYRMNPKQQPIVMRLIDLRPYS